MIKFILLMQLYLRYLILLLILIVKLTEKNKTITLVKEFFIINNVKT